MKNTLGLARLLVVLFVLSILAGCSRERAAAPMGAFGGTHAKAGEVGVTQLAAADRSLIVTIDTAVTVDDVDAASERLRAAVEQAGGFVEGARIGGAEGETSAHLELRVPADKARNVRAAIAELGSVTSTTEKVEDVTEERADLEARLRNARTQETRLLQIMAEKTASIPDLVEAEKEIARVRENVERLEAQDRSMKSKIQLATVRVTLSAKTTPAWKTPGTSIVRAGKSGVEAAQALSVAVAMAIAATGPTLLPILAIIAAIVMIVRRRRASAIAAMVG